jgi:glyoxylase-like metal-dependent hydrolase (beta-lactamase superfamily II)
MLLLDAFCHSAPDTVTFQLRSGKLTVLTESRSVRTNSILINASAEDQSRFIPNGTYPSGTHAFLYRPSSGAAPFLIDTADGFNLIENLNSLGVSLAGIASIYITHMHGDHIGGLLNGSVAVFPNAQVFIEESEFAYWKNLSDSGDSRGAQAGRVFNGYGERIVQFKADGSAVGQTGVKAFAEYGHTPGHTGFLIEDYLLWGDVTHAMAIQMPRPRVAVTYDLNPYQAIESRLSILDRVIQNGWKVGGAHIPWPAVGAIAKSGEEEYAFAALSTDAPTPSPSPTANSKGKTAAIIVACVLAVIVVLAIAIVCVVRRRQAYRNFDGP